MIPNIQMPLWRLVLVACLIIFGISIFPFETSAAKTPTPTSFYQGEPMPVKTTNQKPQAKKRKKKKQYISGGIYVLSNITPHIIEIRGCFGDRSECIKTTAASIMSDSLTPKSLHATRLSATARNKTPELPSKPIFPKMEFILPGILIGRKKKRSVV